MQANLTISIVVDRLIVFNRYELIYDHKYTYSTSTADSIKVCEWLIDEDWDCFC